jgi:hypothetical protein
MKSFATVAAVLCGVAGTAAAQSASATVSSSSPSVAPGGSVTVTVSVDYDTGLAGGGLFGAPGFYGFGGNVVASGDAAANVSGAGIAIDPQLGFGTTASTPGGGVVARAAAGRGLDGGLSGGMIDVMSFELSVDAGAVVGTSVTLDFEGAAVLVEDSNLVTYATAPGLNQQVLVANGVTVTIGQGGCNAADLAEPFGVLDLSDITTFVGAFTTQDPSADLDQNGIFDLSDVTTFVGAFVAGCP